MRSPWSREELQTLLHSVKERIEAEESACADVRPVPPLAEREARDLMLDLLDLAATRTLTQSEIFLGGQLLSQYRQAVYASMLGKKGRYYVISEDELAVEIDRVSQK